jgi:hypothetical protein
MTNLALIIEQIKNEITVDPEGKGKASIRAVARLMDVDHVSLLNSFKSGEQNPSKLAEMLTEYGFDSGEQISWSEAGIPDVAIAVIAKYYAYKAGRYCKKQAELVDTVFTSIGVRVWMQKQVGWEKQESKDRGLVGLCQDASILIDLILDGTDVHPNLKAAVKANQIAKIYPVLASAMEESKSLLSIPVEDKLIRPGKLAELYEAKTGVKLSAQRMNSLLAEKGLQVKNTANNNPLWLPTEEGKQYSQVVLDTAKGHNKTVQSLQWYPSVVDVI